MVPNAKLGEKVGIGRLTVPAGGGGGGSHKETKSELVASPLPCRGPKRGRICYRTPAFSGVPNQKGTKSELPKPCLFGVPKEGGTATEPLCLSRMHNAKRRKNIRIGCLHTCLLGGPKSQGERIRIGCLSPALSGGQKRADLLRNPWMLGGHQRQAHAFSGVPDPKGTKSQVADSHLPARGPEKGRYVTPTFSGVANTKRMEKIRMGCLTPVFSRVPNQKGAKS